MSFEPGGRADKLGNRYEERWVLKQFFRLINEEVVSITIEPTGEDEVGVEFWVKNKDGKREGHQCKARNSDKEKWTIADYKNKKILKNVKYQLDRDPSFTFNIVSAVPNTLLGDICDSARNSGGYFNEFYKSQILTRGESVQKTFNEFCIAMDLDKNKEEDLQTVYNYLRRIKIILFPDNEVTKQDLLREASFMFTGKPETVFASLSKYAIENDKLGNPITSNDLLTYLERQGILLKQLGINTVMPVVSRLQNDFKESIKPNLINGNLIKRIETDKCIEALNQDGLLIITGDSGVGKSGVLYELTTCFEKEGIVYLPLRVDRQIPKINAFHYGNEIGFSDSPVYSIGSIIDNEKAVIIIDQLDAIRWTGSHSANALDVCKELINQVLFLKRQGKQINLIVSCRSFDLKYDPELKNWFDNKVENLEFKWESIEVNPFTDGNLKDVLGDKYSGFDTKQRTLLSTPQNLYMWLEIQTEYDFHFVTSIDLIREFWSNKRLKIEKEGLSVSDLNNTIDKLTIYMEKNGVISAPKRIVHRNSQVALNALKSHSIIREQNGTLSFSHQSYLDFLIAERVVEAIESGENIIEWLGSKSNQTLFRREQLRQAMLMLSQERYYSFAELAKDILNSDSIRFHLKHLVLEVIGQSMEYDNQIEELLINLVENNYWREHVLETVFIGNSYGVKMLGNKGFLREWIFSNDEIKVNTSINLLNSVNNSFPKELVGLLYELFKGSDQLQEKLIHVIGWDAENDTEEIFNLRLRLAEKNKYHHYCNWTALSKKHPLRTIKYIGAILDSIDSLSSVSEDGYKSRIEKLYKSDLKNLLIMAENYSIQVWDYLLPKIVKNSPQFDEVFNRIKWREHYGEYSLIEGTIRLIIKAGSNMASIQPSDYIERAKIVLNNDLETIKEFVYESLSYLPSKYADYGIRVFLENINKIIHLGGSSFNMPKGKFAREIIDSHSPYCTEELFRGLEELIYFYHEPDELDLAKWYLKYRRDGYYYNFYWGETQYLLLSRLDSKRTSDKTKALISVLRRRYNGRSDDEIANVKNYRGGVVGSKLNRNLFKISDKSWLKILQNPKVKKDSSKLWTEDKTGSLIESSIFQFASSLEKVAKTNPERFGLLSLKLSTDVSPSYIAAIFRALALKEYDSDMELEEWQPASEATVLKVLKRHLNVNSREIAIEFCRLIIARNDIIWTDEIINTLKFMSSNHCDPEKGVMNIHRTDWDGNMDTLSTSELFDNSINSVRGKAVEAIGTFLWKDKDSLNKFEDTIEKVILDPHPSVKISLVGTLIPIINIDKSKAVNWFVKNSMEDIRVVEERYSITFMNYTIKEYHDRLEPVLEKMISSEHEEVVILGSRMATAYHIIYNIFSDLINRCLNGTLNQKKGIIIGAGELIGNDDFSDRCIEILNIIIDEYNPELKNEMDRIFRFDSDKFKYFEDFTKKYIKSQYFSDSSNLIYILLDYEDDLIDYKDIILSLSHEISEYWADKKRDISNRLRMASTELPKLLIRLYNDSLKINDYALRDECLNLWDSFFENHVGTVRELTDAINM